MAKSYVCFDIGSEYLKMVEVASDAGGVQLKNFAVAPLEQKPEMTNDDRNNAMAQAMRGMLAEKRIKTRNISISISGQSVFTRFVQLPPVDEAKVAQIIKFEAQQQVPFPIDEVEWDYHIIGNSKGEEINVVLVAIKKEIVMGMIASLKKAGYDVDTISVAPLSIYNSVAYNEDLYSGVTGVIDLGAKTTTLIVCDGDGLWSRNIPIGSENITQAIAKEMNIDITEAERLKRTSYVEYEGGGAPSGSNEQSRQAAKVIGGVCSRLLSEIRRSIGFYRTQSKGSAGVQRILLSGGGMALGHLREYMENTLKVPVEKLFPVKKLSIAGAADRNELNSNMHLLCDAVGLGIRMAGKSRISINLLPKIIAYQKELSRKKIFIAGAAICIIATILSLAIGKKKERTTEYQPQIAKLTSEIDRLRPFKESIQKFKGEIAQIDSKVKNISKLQNARLYWVEFIDALRKKKPKNAWFTEIKVGGIERSNYSFDPFGGGGFISPYSGMGGGGSMSGMMIPPGGGGGVRTGIQNPFSKDTTVEGDKGTIELTGYLRIKKISGAMSQDISQQVTELRLTLENTKEKVDLGVAWKGFGELQMPNNPTTNGSLQLIYAQMQNRKTQLESQVNAYLQNNVVPRDFITLKSMDKLFEEADETKRHQEMQTFADKLEQAFESFSKAAKTATAEKDASKEYEQLILLVGAMPKEPYTDSPLKDAYSRLAQRKKQIEEQISEYSKTKTITADYSKDESINMSLDNAKKKIGDERRIKEYQELAAYNEKFEQMLAFFVKTTRADFFGKIQAIRYEELKYMLNVAKFVFKAKLNRAIEF